MAQGTESGERLTPTGAFGLLGNETRLAILRELAQQRRVNWQFEGMRFAELRRAVGVRDAGTFSYHLDALSDEFIEKHGEEYVLKSSGLEIADAILTGRYGATDGDRTAAVDYVCPECSSQLRAYYGHGRFALFCDEHDHIIGTTLPPAAVDGRSMERVVEIAVRDMQHDMEQARNGVCFHCWGEMDIRLQRGAPIEHPMTGETYDIETASLDEEVVAVLGCARCELVAWLAPDICVTRHPANVVTRYEEGIDATTLIQLSPQVELERTLTVTSQDPLRVSLTYDGGTGQVTFVLDEDGSVDSVERK
ncbi:Helix-turn-helix domain-containing protein [Halovenus aranensis]|uniref:Helix-turn-helix domain-containing protein n=1 Tax=Halovenus aranensis TaxID=890420 RepID=A0A1G8T0C1_9EURY|nr:helix-turn-helix domain-containing protein [Halovenus aranensis]SDJ34938.1 Helix-turn-helix domain-containing protein [Halovenus aranensis]